LSLTQHITCVHSREKNIIVQPYLLSDYLEGNKEAMALVIALDAKRVDLRELLGRLPKSLLIRQGNLAGSAQFAPLK
jgi:hypothetical protein